MKRHPRRLLFVTDACAFGGAERYILDMAAAARHHDLAPAICWLPFATAPDDLFTAADQSEIPLFHSTPAGPRPGQRRRCLRDALRSFQPDALIVNAAGRPRFWQVCWQARAAGIPAAWVHHMVDQLDPRRVPPQWLGGTMEGPQWWRVPQALRHHLAARAAAVVITSNTPDRDRVARWHRANPSKLRIISPGVDATRFTPNGVRPPLPRGGQGGCIPAQPFTIGTAARLVPGKGLELLITSLAQLRARGIPATLLIAGQGPQRAALEALAARLNLADAVQFLGFSADMPVFHQRLDVFALCSETESFGLALTEAMSCARPVVATPTAGARQQIRHLDTGWLLADHSPSELTAALAALYASPNLRDRLAQNARASVEQNFTIDLTLTRTLEALAAPRRHGRTNSSRNICHSSAIISQSL